MLAVCRTIGRRDFCPSLVKLHSAQLTSSNRNTKPLLADEVYRKSKINGLPPPERYHSCPKDISTQSQEKRLRAPEN